MKTKTNTQLFEGGGEKCLCATRLFNSRCVTVFSDDDFKILGVCEVDRAEGDKVKPPDGLPWNRMRQMTCVNGGRYRRSSRPRPKKETNSLFVDIYTYMYLFSKSSVKECASYPIARLFFSESKNKVFQ